MLHLLPFGVALLSFFLCSALFDHSEAITRWVMFKSSSSKSYLKTYQQLSEPLKIEWATRIVSTAHAALVFTVSAFQIFSDFDGLSKNPVLGDSPLVDIVIATSIGYFLSDARIVTRYSIEPFVPIMTHHLLAAAGFSACIAIGFGRWFSVGLLLTEASNPFNNFHWMLQQLSHQDSKTFRWTEVCYGWSWVLWRLLPHPFLLERLFAHWDDVMTLPWIAIALIIANFSFLITLNVVFFFIGPPLAILMGWNYDGKRAGTAKIAQLIRRKALKHPVSG